MNLKICEKTGDLFDYQDEYYLAHCIASDFGMMGGIAKQFVDRMNMREKLRGWYASQGVLPVMSSKANPQFPFVIRPELVGKSVLIDTTFNLITKLSTSHQPSYEDLSKSLLDMRSQIQKLNIKKLAMPRIGCGIDGLSWTAVYALIVLVFKDLDIEITIVSLPDTNMEDGAL